jgi:hypothetical protein
VEPATMDRIQQLIDDEAVGRFPADAVPRLALLRHGDHPVIEPGELYLQVIIGPDAAARDAWREQHFGGSRNSARSGFPRSRGSWSPPTSPAALATAPSGS